jgi:hypothetical protein
MRGAEARKLVPSENVIRATGGSPRAAPGQLTRRRREVSPLLWLLEAAQGGPSPWGIRGGDVAEVGSHAQRVWR